MITLQRNRRSFYLCKKYVEGNLQKYKEPKLVYDNYQPTNSETDLIASGENYQMYLRIVTGVNDKDKYAVGDRLYVYVKPPLEHDVLCKDADYEIINEPIINLNVVEIKARKLSGKYYGKTS